MKPSPLAHAEDFERHVAINVRGTFNGLREAAKSLLGEHLLAPGLAKRVKL